VTTIALESKRQNPNRLDFYSHFKVTLGSCGHVTYIKMKRPFVQCSPARQYTHGECLATCGRVSDSRKKRDKTTKQTHVQLDEFCG